MDDVEQRMSKLRLRRLLEEVIDGEVLQLDIEEDEEAPAEGQREPTRRLTLVVRYLKP